MTNVGTDSELQYNTIMYCTANGECVASSIKNKDKEAFEKVNVFVCFTSDYSIAQWIEEWTLN